MKKITIAIVVLLYVSGCAKKLPQKQPNILFIAIDDLRPELGSYGSEIAVSPNIDALASQGLQFNNAYCQQAICGPSRASLLTGQRPATSGIIHNYLKIRELNPDIITLPQHFGNNGYNTAYCGKIFHHGDRDDKISWNFNPAKNKIPPFKNIFGGFALKENQNAKKKNIQDIIAKYGKGSAVRGLGSSGPAYESADVSDRTYWDGYNTELAIATMKEMLKDSADKPFFLGLGFNKPHLNWVAPKKYWDMYNREDIKLTTQVERPENGSAMGLHRSFELRVRHGIPKYGDLDDSLAITLKHAYLACVSYVDAQIGMMIEALEEANVRDNTVIILWSDHGWHLGDMGVWGKATNYEIATRVPMLFWSPNMSEKARGAKTDALVELVDIYPTICEAAGITPPEHIEGKSFIPLTEDPQQPWKKAVFSQFPTPALREWGAHPLSDGMKETYFGPLIEDVEGEIIEQVKNNWERDLFENYIMGYAMRTSQYRLVIWKDRRDFSSEPIFVELYDHDADPHETKNIGADNPALVKELIEVFDREWEAAHLNKS
ncbi:sulfatase [Reichenbachiella versicolor]|uniref:sulfatase n=1 Tax=Reichenbachiella versicolor TaxID=1821036 RepID=UPI000D6E2B57|nr:sulfatase [Reichenbachiella versicolor]